MPIPVTWKTVSVFGTFTGSNGLPAKGYVEFESDQVVSVEGVVVVPRTKRVTLDANGSFTTELPSTNDPDITPSGGWAYLVTEGVRGGREPYSIFIPYDSPGVNLSTVTPVVDTLMRVPYTLEIGTVTMAGENDPASATLDNIGPGKQRLNVVLPVSNVSGMTQGASDARYIKLAQINQPSGVAGLDSNSSLDEDQLPLPPINLSLLFENAIT